MNRLSITILFIYLTFSIITAHGQTTAQFLPKIDTLKNLLSKADTLRPFDETVENIGDSINKVNDEICFRLADILTTPQIINLNLDSLMAHPFLGVVHSNDKRLWIFTWYENTGGSWKSNLNMVHYRTQSGKLKVDYESSKNENETEEKSNTNVFCSNGAWFDKIYKLNSGTKNLYLCIGSGVSCNTCIYKIATVVELTKDSINFNYPAFPFTKTDDNSPGSQSQSCFTVEARWEHIEKFEFSPRTQTLSYTLVTDDKTLVRSSKQKRIIRRLVFDRDKFKN